MSPVDDRRVVSGSIYVLRNRLPWVDARHPGAATAVSVTAKTASITEGADAVFTVRVSRAPGSDLTVHLAVSEAGSGDFVAPENEGAASVTIPKGETEASFTVTTVDDAADEPDGTVTVTLAGDGEDGRRYTVAAAPKDAAATAVSDDVAATVPTLSVDDAKAAA